MVEGLKSGCELALIGRNGAVGVLSALSRSERVFAIDEVAFLGIAAALLLFSFATNGLNAHWAALLTDHGASAESAALVLAVAGFAALASKLGTGYLLDRFRANRVAALLVLVCAIGFVLVLFGHAFWLSVASALLIGAGMGAESDAVPYLLTRYFGLRRFSELYGYTWCVYAVAGASGPVAMGLVFDHTGSYRKMLPVALILVLATAGLFALLPGYRSSEGAGQRTSISS